MKAVLLARASQKLSSYEIDLPSWRVETVRKIDLRNLRVSGFCSFAVSLKIFVKLRLSRCCLANAICPPSNVKIIIVIIVIHSCRRVLNGIVRYEI